MKVWSTCEPLLGDVGLQTCLIIASIKGHLYTSNQFVYNPLFFYIFFGAIGNGVLEVADTNKLKSVIEDEGSLRGLLGFFWWGGLLTTSTRAFVATSWTRCCDSFSNFNYLSSLLIGFTNFVKESWWRAMMFNLPNSLSKWINWNKNPKHQFESLLLSSSPMLSSNSINFLSFLQQKNLTIYASICIYTFLLAL